MTIGKKCQLNFRRWKADRWVVFEHRGGGRPRLCVQMILPVHVLLAKAAAYLFQTNSKRSGIRHTRYLWRRRCRAELKTERVALLYEVSTNPSDHFLEPRAARGLPPIHPLPSPPTPHLNSRKEASSPEGLNPRHQVRLKARVRETKWKSVRLWVMPL